MKQHNCLIRYNIKKYPNLALKHFIVNMKLYAINPVPYIVNLKCYNIHPKPYTLNHKPLNIGPKICYTKESVI